MSYNYGPAFVTGAGSGIGRAMAIQLASAGSPVALADVNEEGIRAAAAEIEAAGGKAITFKLDVSDRAAVMAAVQATHEAFGGIGFIANNAGVTLTDLVSTMQESDFRWLMEINFWGVVHGTQAALPLMLKQGRGHIVNISSLFGIIGVPSQSAYCAAKHAVKGFNESLHYELAGTGVSIHSIHPGGVNTNIVRGGRHRRNAEGDTDTRKMQSSFQPLAITTPDEAARVILTGVANGDYRIIVGKDARFADRFQRFFPNLWRKFFGRGMKRRKAF